jgi:hypothetical protein
MTYSHEIAASPGTFVLAMKILDGSSQWTYSHEIAASSGTFVLAMKILDGSSQ